MKKLLAFVLTISMLVTMLIGCAPKADNASEESPSATSKPSADKDTTTPAGNPSDAVITAGNWKIGYLASSSADAGQTLPTQESLKHAVEALGCTVVEVIPASTSPDDLITAVENLINQGCDAICLYNQIHMNGLVATVIDLCEEAGVYVSFYNTKIKEGTDAYDAAMDSEYFVSAHFNENEKAGYNAMAKLGELGCKKVCVFGLPTSNLTGEDRYRGAEAAAKEYGIEILCFNSDLSLFNAAGGTTVAESFLAAYPDMEGVLITGGTGNVMSGYSTVMEGKGIPTSAIDFSEGQTAFLDNGVLAYVTGGHISGATYAVIMLVNKLNGSPLVDGPAFVEDKFLEADGPEEAAKYDTCYFGGVDLFSDEEIRNCSVAFNPAATYDTLKQFIDNYTVEGLMAKYE
jgi:ABC-type sugar transport system substrate-binding protein